MGTTPWNEVLAESKLSSDEIAAIREEVREEVEREQLTLSQVRRARAMTQVTVAENSGIAQGDISKLERRADAYVGTLRRYIEALGGSLHIVAEFPNGAPVEIAGFGATDEPAEDSVASHGA